MLMFVTVKYQIPALHKWEDANSYLRNLHRHVFYFTVWLEVFHNDREVEFISLKEKLAIFTPECMYEHSSCEMMAESIIEYLELNYPNRQVKVWVEEDGENGSYIERSPF